MSRQTEKLLIVMVLWQIFSVVFSINAIIYGIVTFLTIIVSLHRLYKDDLMR